MTKAYKLALRVSHSDFGEAYTSYVVHGKARTIYRINWTVVVPRFLSDKNHYPLLFDTISNALNFLATTKDDFLERCVILECDVAHQVHIPEYMDLTDLSRGLFYKMVGINYTSGFNGFPFGTVSYMTVIPVRTISVEDALKSLGYEYQYAPVYSVREGVYSAYDTFWESTTIKPGWPSGYRFSKSYESVKECPESSFIVKYMEHEGFIFPLEIINTELSGDID